MPAQVIYLEFGQNRPLICYYADIYTIDRLKITFELKAISADDATAQAIEAAKSADINQIQCLIIYQGTPSSHHRHKEPLVVLHANVRNELVKC